MCAHAHRYRCTHTHTGSCSSTLPAPQISVQSHITCPNICSLRHSETHMLMLIVTCVHTYSHTKILTRSLTHLSHIFTTPTSPNTHIYTTHTTIRTYVHMHTSPARAHTFTFTVTHIYMNTGAQIFRHTQRVSCTAVYTHGHSHTERSVQNHKHMTYMKGTHLNPTAL